MSLCVASIPDSILGLVSFCWSFAARRVEDVCRWTVRLSRCFAPNGRVKVVNAGCKEQRENALYEDLPEVEIAAHLGMSFQVCTVRTHPCMRA